MWANFKSEECIINPSTSGAHEVFCEIDDSTPFFDGVLGDGGDANKSFSFLSKARCWAYDLFTRINSSAIYQPRNFDPNFSKNNFFYSISETDWKATPSTGTRCCCRWGNSSSGLYERTPSSRVSDQCAVTWLRFKSSRYEAFLFTIMKNFQPTLDRSMGLIIHSKGRILRPSDSPHDYSSTR